MAEPMRLEMFDSNAPANAQQAVCAAMVRIGLDAAGIVGAEGAINALLTAIAPLADQPGIDLEAVREALRELADALPRMIEERRVMNAGGGHA